MDTNITNYDGGVVTGPQKVVRPESVEELQAILRDTERFPSPVRAMGSFHSLTPCASSSGTIVRCNIPLGSYFIRQDASSLLSYSYDGDILSLDPIHAYSHRDKLAWEHFLQEFNAWAHSRGGIPLLNQSPFVAKEHVVAAYGERWQQLSDWVRTVDPNGRMLNPFFKELL